MTRRYSQSRLVIDEELAKRLAALGMKRVGQSWSAGPEIEACIGCSMDQVVIVGRGVGVFAKAHLQLVRRRHVVGHLKVALTEHASQSIIHEVEVLRSVAEASHSFVVPAVLGAGMANGWGWSVQSLMDGSPARLATPDLVRLAIALSSAHIPAPAYPTPAGLSCVGSSYASGAHGDLIPRNVIRQNAGKQCIGLIDWEWATPAASAGFDVCHHYLGGALTRSNFSLPRSIIGLLLTRRVLRLIGLPPDESIRSYLDGMTQFYRWCAVQAGSVPDSEPVVRNASILTGGLRARR